MKKLLYYLIIIIIFLLVIIYKEDILRFYNQYIANRDQIATTLEKNEYFRDYNFKYVQNTENFSPKNKQDIINIFYTVINSGMNEFTFYCPQEYESCLDDIKDLTNQTTIPNISGFVHPYNSFKNIDTNISTSSRKITVTVDKNYTQEMQIILEYKVNEILKENITSNMTNKEKIKAIHDYIINHTNYDQDRSDKNIIKYKSDTAYGVLIEGYGICSGYTDSMMIFLEKFGIKNYKISNQNHIWNYVNLDDEWYHLDLTFDDRITNTGENILIHDFFLIKDQRLLELDPNQHIYDKTVFGI